MLRVRNVRLGACTLATVVGWYSPLGAGQTRQTSRLTVLSKPSGNRWAAPAISRSAKGVTLYRTISPSVVLIVTEDGFGSGSLVDAMGNILTNLHVVNARKDVVVVFKPAIEGAEPVKNDMRMGRVLKYDEVADLALIKVPDVPQGHPFVRLGDDIDINVGSDVHAIGHPTGEAWSYTTGVVSQVRSSYEWSADDGFKHKADVVQTQTPMSPGSSGGPLLSDTASLIGVNSFISMSGQNLNFAVSVKDVRSFLTRSGDRRAEGQGVASRSMTAPTAGDRVSDIRIAEVQAPYSLIRPQTRTLLLVNTSSTPVRLVTVGSLEAPTGSGRCPGESSSYAAIRALPASIAGMDSLSVTADFTVNSRFFCILQVQ